MERRELHPAVGSERCAGLSPTASPSPQSLSTLDDSLVDSAVYMRWPLGEPTSARDSEALPILREWQRSVFLPLATCRRAGGRDFESVRCVARQYLAPAFGFNLRKA